MKVLIIYENVPESTDFYVIEVNNEEFQILRDTVGVFVNSERWQETRYMKAHEFLSARIEANEDAKLNDFKIDGVNLLNLHKDYGIEYVIWTGFYL